MPDFSSTRLWDVHAHPFLNRGAVTPDEFLRLTGFGGGWEPYFAEAGVKATPELSAEINQWARNTTWHKLLVRELAGYFGCERSLEAVVAARNTAVEASYKDYVSELYED